MSSYLVLLLRTSAEWFAFMFLVYFAMASFAYRLLWAGEPERFEHKRIQSPARRAADPFAELSLSVLALLVLAVMLGGLHVLTALGWAKLYDDVAAHGIGYFFLSILVIAVIHDTYYYFAHRWMHLPRVFVRVHRLHHQFLNPTPFAAFALHPLEGMVDLAVIGVLIIAMPIHPWAIAVYYVAHTALNVVSHLGFEFYPAWVSRWFVTSTHHNLHHQHVTGHYMLYVNLWDRLGGTNSEDYRRLSQRLATAKRAPERKAI